MAAIGPQRSELKPTGAGGTEVRISKTIQQESPTGELSPYVACFDFGYRDGSLVVYVLISNFSCVLLRILILQTTAHSVQVCAKDHFGIFHMALFADCVGCGLRLCHQV